MAWKWNPFTNNLDYYKVSGGSGNVDIIHVLNFSALPDPTTVSLYDIYIADNEQGTQWLPGRLGGTYYPAGAYYSNLVKWVYSESASQATQVEVNTGTITDKFVTPETLNNYSGWNKTKVGLSNVVNADTTTTSNISDSSNKRFVTDANLVVIGNTSNTNTGDETTSSIQTKLGTASSLTSGYLTSTDWITFNSKGNGTVTSVGLTMPSAFTVTNSPIISSGDIAITGSGIISQYIRGDGTLATFPTTTGGGSSVAYYLNGGTSQGTISGNAYYQLSKNAVIGTGVDFSLTNTTGYIADFLTDVGDPSLLSIPQGAWNFYFYFSSSAPNNSGSFYVELYKYDGTTFTLISTSSATPELITNGTVIDLYTTSTAVPLTTLTLTDRLAIRVFVNTNGNKTITLHTQDSNLCEIITTFSTGINTLNSLSAQVQYFTTGTSGTDFTISSATDTHTFNLPSSSAANRGLLSSTDWSTFNGKQDTISLTTTGSSGVSTLIANVLNVPTYTISGLGGVPTSRQLTINGTAFDLSTDRTWNVGTVTSVSALTLGTTGIDLSSTVADGTTTPVITLNVPTASATNRGALSSADWSTFNGKQDALTIGNLTDVGTDGITITGGTGAIIGSGVDISQQVANATQNGYLSSTDWINFNSAAPAFIPKLSANETYRGITINNNSTTVVAEGGVTMSVTGSTLAQTVTSTNFATKQIRLRYYNSTVSGGRYGGNRGSALLWYIHGGFRYVCDFNISDTSFSSSCQQFYGLAGQTGDLGYGGVTGTLVSTLFNIIGIGNEVGDTNLQVFHNSTSGTATKVDLGVGFPANRTVGTISTTVYSIQLYNEPMSTTVKYEVINKETGAIAQGTISINLPLTSQGLNFFASRTMGNPSVTATGQFDMSKFGVYSL
jgi:hypothetical protein